ncbi:MAG: tocopherol cyclase family protein [Candidatus Humimicrobiaceae bacterium]
MKKLYKPEIFQGWNKTERYFEGWYFKLVDKEARNIFAIIPSISISGIKTDSYAFIQVMDGRNATSRNYRFDFSEFSYSREEFEISIGNNHFSSKSINLDIEQDSSIIKADLRFHNMIPWPKTITSPGAMGYYSFLPFLECYHGVVSMDHLIEGSANFGGGNIDFSEGRGYIEKDWGISFPQGWIWLQSNHFSKLPTSIMLSIAKIPLGKRSFTGFICGIVIGKEFYLFATYNGSRVRSLKYLNNSVSMEIESRNYKVNIEAKRKNTATLLSPILGSMDGRINESIDAEVKIVLEKKTGRRTEVIFEDTGHYGGLEITKPEVLS